MLSLSKSMMVFRLWEIPLLFRAPILSKPLAVLSERSIQYHPVAIILPNRSSMALCSTTKGVSCKHFSNKAKICFVVAKNPEFALCKSIHSAIKVVRM
jgi:hypothetical protein